MYTFLSDYVCACARVCVCMCVSACVRVCVCLHVRARVFAFERSVDDLVRGEVNVQYLAKVAVHLCIKALEQTNEAFNTRRLSLLIF